MNAAIRTPLVLPVAGAVTVGLFLLMRSLVDIGPVSFDEAIDRPSIEIDVGVPDTEVDRTRRPNLPEPVDPPPAPETTPVDRAVPDSGQLVGVTPAPPIDRTELTPTGGTFAADGNPIPVVRINPVYPDNLAIRGVEGQCTMLFDIMPDGRTANVRAINCTNTGFANASVRAVERWRYSPQVRNGQPEIYHGATTQLIFRLET